MKMKKLARVFTSAALVSAMVATMGGMTAFAASVTEIGLTKTVTTDGETFEPNTSFAFTITSNGGSDGEKVEVEEFTLSGKEYGATGDQKLTVYKGIKGALNFGTGFSGTGSNELAFTPGEDNNDNGEDLTNSFTNSGKLTVTASVFKQPGIYHYTVNETEGSYEGIVYDKAVRHVYLYVNYAKDADGNLTDTLEVGNVVVSKEVDGVETKVGGYEIDNVNLNNKGIEFTNNYGDQSGNDPDPENPKPEDKNDSTHDITIGKTVTGNQGDKKAVFNFTVTVNGDSGEKYKVVDKDGNVQKALTSGKPETYQLKHGETIKITGLTENDTYTVVETEANQNGYTTTYTPGEGATRVNDEGETIQAVAKDGAQYTVTNDRDVTTPTGIVLSFAPYILLVALAGVFGVLFLRRRKEEF